MVEMTSDETQPSDNRIINQRSYRWQTQVKVNRRSESDSGADGRTEEERARRAVRQAEQDPERLRRAESLRLAHTELSRQLIETKHDARKTQLLSALAELDRQLAAMGAARPPL
jgi:hypothetical protein